MLHLQLRETTRDEHASLEKLFLEIIKRIEHQRDYSVFLLKIYGYYSVVERNLKNFLQASLVNDYPQRVKCGHLENDLRTLQVGPLNGVQMCSAVPDVNSFYNALGVLYVLEGSTLGGQIIARILASKLNTDLALTFFRSYGSDTPHMWDRFKSFLENPFTAEQREEIISSALATFITFKNWLRTHEQ